MTSSNSPQTVIMALYRITTAPFVGHLFKTPMVVENHLLGTVVREIAKAMDVDQEHVNVHRIEILEDWDERAVRLTGELPTEAPTTTIAPGIYFRPIVTSPGLRGTSYTLRWARIIGKGTVYTITRKNAFSFESDVVIENATFADVQAWLWNRDLIIAPPAPRD